MVSCHLGLTLSRAPPVLGAHAKLWVVVVPPTLSSSPHTCISVLVECPYWFNIYSMPSYIRKRSLLFI